VTLAELPPEERGPILREFPRKVPHSVQFFQQSYAVSNDRSRRIRDAGSVVPPVPRRGVNRRPEGWLRLAPYSLY
jgi:hypothetical protein